MRIRLQRVYDDAPAGGGARFLVDRLWPRGVRKEALSLTAWAKDAAPSDALRKAFHGHPDRWDEFVEAYSAELDANPDAWRPLLAAARSREGVTLLFAAKDVDRNNAVALKQYLESRAK